MSTNTIEKCIYQYNLNAADVAVSRDTIYYASAPAQTVTLRLAPDDKIYLSTGYFAYNYPFADSAYYPENMNLSVINQPDSLGALCNFQPYSFFLGGKRTYYGLPNNPDYELAALNGSACDSLTGAPSIEYALQKEKLHVFYHSGWQVTFINANSLQGKNYTLEVFDLSGRRIFSQQGKLSSKYFSKKLQSNFSSGIYIITLSTEKEILSSKSVIE